MHSRRLDTYNNKSIGRKPAETKKMLITKRRRNIDLRLRYVTKLLYETIMYFLSKQAAICYMFSM